ncbi:MAG: polyphenol oxidase family protein [Acidimicrobiales bacterium]
MPALRPRYTFTARRHGDLAIAGPADALAERRRAIVDLPWSWLRQEHGRRVVTVTEPGEGAGVAADAAVTGVPGAALVVHTADCAPVVLLADSVVGVAHAGWRGLASGIMEATVEAMRTLNGATDGAVRAVVGPCIRPECYEFGPDDLDRLAATLGDEVRATTATGAPALDLAAAVRTALATSGVTDVEDRGGCTACGGQWFSHRGRRDTGRQAAVVWLDAP